MKINESSNSKTQCQFLIGYRYGWFAYVLSITQNKLETA